MMDRQIVCLTDVRPFATAAGMDVVRVDEPTTCPTCDAELLVGDVAVVDVAGLVLRCAGHVGFLPTGS
jgi:hypothetical protein